MLPLADARRHILDLVPRRAPATVAVADAAGLVLAVDVVAGEAVPPFDNTAMDGFAVQAADTADPPNDLTIVETIAAGHAATEAVGPGQASRIFTGAPMPDGADAVVMVERTAVSDDGTTVTAEIEVPEGNHVRPAGDDLSIGQVVFSAGDVLTPGHLGVLNSLGYLSVDVYPRMTVGVLSTGDELIEGPAELQPGQIRDSNRRTLLTLAEQSGFEVVDLGIARDDKAVITDAIRRGVETCDAVITSGGVSMGDIDLVKVILDEIGEMRWMQVGIKPAKPLAFGHVDGIPVFGLPGNPVSSMVSFELFARPALRQAMGYAQIDRPVVVAMADEDLLRRHGDDKIHFARVTAHHGDHGRIRVRSAGGQGSHQLGAMASANALAVLRDGVDVHAGDDVDCLLVGDVPSTRGLPTGE